MGMYDNVVLEDGFRLPRFPEDRDPTELRWQTKDIGMPAMQTYKLTTDGRLLRKEQEYREKTDEEKAEEAAEKGFDSWEEYIEFFEEADPEEQLERGVGIAGPTERVVDEVFWLDHNMHGSFEFHASDDEAEVGDDDGFYWSFEARFTRGELDEVVFLGERGSGDPDDVRPDEPLSIEF